MALIKHFFAELGESDQVCKLQRLLETSKSRKIVKTKNLMEALREMEGTDDCAEFKSLSETLHDQQREDLIKTRLFASKSKAEFATPSPIKELKPDFPEVVLTYQIPANTFAGYYPKGLTEEQLKNKRLKRAWTRSRTFGEKWTQLEALQQVVTFLWDCHAKQKRESGLVEISNGPVRHCC